MEEKGICSFCKDDKSFVSLKKTKICIICWDRIQAEINKYIKDWELRKSAKNGGRK